MSLPEIRPQQRREHPEPHESSNPMPWVVVALTAAMMTFGVVYIAGASIDDAAAWGDGRSAAELRGASAGAGGAVDGAALYASRCAACHQANGAGLPGVFPPLAGSEWVVGKPSTLATIVLHGVEGTITVKGATYAGAMPPFAAQLKDAELAALLTHLRTQWGNAAPPIDADAVAAVRRDTAGRTGPLMGDAELAALK